MNAWSFTSNPAYAFMGRCGFWSPIVVWVPPTSPHCFVVLKGTVSK
jgi:hypothetical protein